MRHGQSEANEAGIIVSDPASGRERFGLTETGRAQAAVSLQNTAVRPALIVSSDFLRARETADIAAEFFQCTAVTDARLRERFFGSYNGTSDDHYRIVWAHDERGESPGEGVELPEHVLARALSVIEDLEKTASGTIILVSHGDVCQILLAWALGRRPNEHRSIAHMKTAELRALNPG